MSRLGRKYKAGRANIPPYYTPESFFNRPLGPTDTLAADQTPAQAIANQINYGRQSGYTFQGYSGVGYYAFQWPWSLAFNGPSSSTFPVYCVRPSDPTQNITFHQVAMCYNNAGTYTTYGQVYTDIQAAMASVPIPDKTLCPKITGVGNYADIWSGASSSDQSCTIINLDTNECWEFIKLSNTRAPNIQAQYGTPWTCLFGGYTPNVAKFNGIFPLPGGSRACNLGNLGGLITLQDVVNVYHGEPINHAIVMAVPCNNTSHVPPATRGDGPLAAGNSQTVIPPGYPGAGGANPAYHHDGVCEGMRFRFPSNVDLSGITYPVGLAIARAIRDYGLYNVDTAGAVAIYIEDNRTLGSPYNMQGIHAVDPYALTWPSGGQYGGGWRGDPANTGFTVLHELPWSQLQALNTITS